MNLFLRDCLRRLEIATSAQWLTRQKSGTPLGSVNFSFYAKVVRGKSFLLWISLATSGHPAIWH